MHWSRPASNPFESIKLLAARHGAHALIGAGTVLGTADVARVNDAGGRLIVAPNFDAEVVRAAKAAGLAALPGVMTPSEGFDALQVGADGLKLFPAEIIPPAVFKAWRAVFPADALLLAVGGVGVDNVGAYREAGASGYGIGSALYKPGRPVVEIKKLARALVAAAKA
jgi:2-dehydro-3-deoxyphosphogalactonate aldolase